MSTQKLARVNLLNSRRDFIPACALLTLLALGSGCAYGELRQVLRAQVASEIDCPDVVVQKSTAYAPGYKENQYTVRGCGVDRIYNCSEDGLVSYGNAKCSYVAGGAAAKPAAPAGPAPGGPGGPGGDADDTSAEPSADPDEL